MKKRPARRKKGRILRWTRHHTLRLTRLKDTPESIAKGASWGVFIGIFPSFGFGMIVAPLVAGLLKWNKGAAFIGNFIMNPVTGPFFWGLSAVVGGMMFGMDLAALKGNGEGFSMAGLAGGIGNTAKVLLAGNFVVSAFFSLFTYPVVKRWVEKKQQGRLAKVPVRAEL